MSTAEARVDAIVDAIDRDVAAVSALRLAEQHPPASPYLVYRLYDWDWGLVYVGATNDLARRIAAHRLEAWWIDIDETVIVTEHFATVEAAAAREGQLIGERQPTYNVLGTRGRKYRAYGTQGVMKAAVVES